LRFAGVTVAKRHSVTHFAGAAVTECHFAGWRACCVGQRWQPAGMPGPRVFSGADAVAREALTYRDLRRHTRVYRNIYLRRGVELTAKDRAIAAWLWSGKRAVVAGNSAAVLLGAKWGDAASPAELIGDRRHFPPLIVVRNESLLPGEVTSVASVPVTSPARTAYDLGRRPGFESALARIDALAHATAVTAADVLPLIEAHRGARGMKQLRRVLPLVDAGAESPQESRTRLVLIAAGLPKPQTQIEVFDDWGRLLARIDMGWELWKVGVEFDGAQHWTDPAQRTWDIDRAAELQRRGWLIVRVSADLLRRRPDVVVARTRDALRAAGCPLV
jgi:hypothetical protein